MTEIYIDPELRGRGLSTSRHYSSDEGEISIGDTHASSSQGHLRIMSIRLKALPDLTIYGGNELISTYKTTPRGDVDQFMWSTVIKYLTPQIIKSAIQESTARGVAKGKEEIQSQLRSLLNIY